MPRENSPKPENEYQKSGIREDFPTQENCKYKKSGIRKNF